MSNNTLLKTPEQILKRTFKSISTLDKFAFTVGFFGCLIVNLFIYTNTCFVHDSIQIYNDFDGTENGRFLIRPLLALFNHMQMPWLIGLITSSVIGIIVVYLVKIFKIQSKVNIIILAGLVITSDCIVVTHMYFSYVYVYMLSLMFSVMAVYYADSKHGCIKSIVLLCLSLFIYQAFVATATGLFIFKLIIDLYENEQAVKKRIKSIIKYSSIVIISMLIYYAVWMLALKISDTALSDYNYYSSMGALPRIGELLNRLAIALSASAIDLFGVTGDSISFLTVINIIVVSITTIMLILNTKGRVNLLLVFIYLVAYFFSINMLYMITNVMLHSLTVFSIVLLPISSLYLCEKSEISKLPKQKAIINWTVCLLLAVLVAGQCITANSLYLKVKINYDNTWSYATRVVDRIEQTEGFTKDTPVVIINYENVTKPYPQNEEINEAVSYPLKFGLQDKWIDSPSGITYAHTLYWFITQEMDMDINIRPNKSEFYEMDEVKKMKIFPDSNSIKYIGDTLVVRIG